MGAALLGRLPLRVSYALADAASPCIAAGVWLHERRAARRGRGLVRNQRIAYREAWSPALSRRLVRGFARHAARLAVDVARLPRLDAAEARRRVELRDLESLRPLQAEGRGLVCVSGHLGVWELCGHVPSLLGVPVTVVARPSGDPDLDRALEALRGSGGQRVRVKRGALWPLVRALRRGEVVGLLADENAAERAIFAPFLGTLAATSPTAAFLQRASGAPIAVVSCPRTGRGRYALRCWRVIRAPADRRRVDLEAVTGEINAALSEAIRAHPEQWLWGSRRYATRPPGESPGADGLPPPAPQADARAR